MMATLRHTLPTAIVCAGILLFSPVAGSDSGELLGAVERSIDNVIVPGYEALSAAAAEQATAVEALCRDGGEKRLSTAREAFEPLLIAFSAMEPYRFGPAREDNRIERLFFWPDPRGRGLRQVQGIIGELDEGATDRENLQQKSVAVQGLPALEFLLFGTGSDDLSGDNAEYRCRYALATALAIADVSRQLHAAWTRPDGISFRLRSPGDTNPIYRTAEESVQELLKSARQQLQATAELKLGFALGDAPDTAKPKTLPFWRSGLALRAVDANLAGIERLLVAWRLNEILDEETTLIADQLHYELETARIAVQTADAIDTDILNVVEDRDGHDRLAYSRIPMKSAIVLLSEDIAAALGLTVGFNALDGD